MPSFVHQSLLWGMLIVGVPVLIHLINMLRHRRVGWAAMEFLLAAQKKNRTWILLKQLFLLLLRMAAVATVVLIVAQPGCSRLGAWFGSKKTHHIVLLDDSFSMSDRWGGTSAFDEAKSVIERIAVKAVRRQHPQEFTLLRFSHAGRITRGTQPDLLAEPLSAAFVGRLRETLAVVEPSQTAAGPVGVLEAIDQLLGDPDDQQRIVYLISDFRSRQWEDPADLRKHLGRLNEIRAEIHLVNCVDSSRPNLAITALASSGGTRAAGVPLSMEVAVHNFGATTAKNVTVFLEQDVGAANAAGAQAGQKRQPPQPRPALKIDTIPPGRTVKERFVVNFPAAGQYQVNARLQSDAVDADNHRYSVLDFPVSVSALLIDGSPEAADARFLRTALAPGGRVRTGISPRIETPRYLSLHPLEGFRSVYLLNVPRLDKSAVAALEQYIAGGGGVGIFLGEQSRSKFINEELYRRGRGFFPVPLAGPAELLVDRLQKAPDLEATEHPIFRIFAPAANNLIPTLSIRRYFTVPGSWSPKDDPAVRVIARLRNGAPLAVERGFGSGRVVAFLTTAAPVWNNWARSSPSFVVAMLDMQNYLAARRGEDVTHRVGTPLKLKLDSSRYQGQVRLVTPSSSDTPTATTGAVPADGGTLTASLGETDTSGIYDVWLTKLDGTPELRRYAFNVDAREGDLRTLGGPELASRLAGVEYRYEPAAAFQLATHDVAGYNLSEALLYLLVLLLIGEQILAYSASCHPPMRGRTGKGVRNLLCEAPEGPFRQKVPDTFSVGGGAR